MVHDHVSDHERDQDRQLRLADEGGLDETSESWGELPENLARNKRAEVLGLTTLLDQAGALTPFATEVLKLEQGWWKYPAAKDTYILQTFDITPTRYYQLLHALIVMPEAVAHDPMTVRRLIRQRDARKAHRTPETRTDDPGNELS